MKNYLFRLFLAAIILSFTTSVVASDSIVVKGKFTGDVLSMSDEMVPLLFSFFKGNLDLYPGKPYHGNGPFFREFCVDEVLEITDKTVYRWAGECFKPRYLHVICMNEGNLYGEKTDIFTLYRFPETDDVYYIKDFIPRSEKDQRELDWYRQTHKWNIDIFTNAGRYSDYQPIKDLLGDFPAEVDKKLKRYDYRYVPFLMKYIDSSTPVINKVHWSWGDRTEEMGVLGYYVNEYMQQKFRMWGENDIKSFYDSLMIRPQQLPHLNPIGFEPVILIDSVYFNSYTYLSPDEKNKSAYISGKLTGEPRKYSDIYYYADLQNRTIEQVPEGLGRTSSSPKCYNNNCIYETNNYNKEGFKIKRAGLQDKMFTDSVTFTITDIPIMEGYRSRNPETVAIPYQDNYLVAWARDSKTTDSIAVGLYDSTGNQLKNSNSLFSMDENTPGFNSINDLNIKTSDSDHIFVSFTHSKSVRYVHYAKQTYIVKLDSDLNVINKYITPVDTLRDISSEVSTTIRVSDSLTCMVRQMSGKIIYDILDKDLQLVSRNIIPIKERFGKICVTPCVDERFAITWTEKIPYQNIIRTALINKNGRYTIKDIFKVESLNMQIFTTNVGDEIDYYFTQEKFKKDYLLRKTVRLSEFQ